MPDSKGYALHLDWGSPVLHTHPPPPKLSRVQVQGNANLPGECHTFLPDLCKGLSSPKGTVQEWFSKPRALFPLEPGSWFSVGTSKPPKPRFLCAFPCPPHLHPPSPLCLLTRQGLTQHLLFLGSQNVLNKTFVLCCCAHDWETRITKHCNPDDLNGYATNNSR